MADRPPLQSRGAAQPAVDAPETTDEARSERDCAEVVRELLLDDDNAPRRHFDAGSTLRPAGQPRNAVFVVEQGWLYSARLLPEGERQVLELSLPGQVVGLGEFGLDRPLSGLYALRDAVVREISWARLRDRMCEGSPFSEHAAMLVARDRLMLEERLTSLGRRTAAQRLGHYLLEMHHRLQPPSDRYRLPVTQQFLADLLGLTSVHVSRMLTELRDSGLVDMTEQGVELIDPDELKLKTDFDPGYLALGPYCEADG